MGKVVEEALEEYARSVEMRPKSETPDAFYDRLLRDYATDLDLEEVIAPLRTPNEAPKMNYPRALTWAPEGP
jgi:hypothetical protein